MITTEGKRHIKRYLAGLEPRLASGLIFGVGASAENAADTALQFEIGYADITLSSYDFVADELVFKAQMPTALTGKVYEVGLSKYGADVLSRRDDMVIAKFDYDIEAWETSPDVPADFTTSNVRVGEYGLILTPTASATESAAISMGLDMGNNSDFDRFAMAMHCSANVASVTVKFLSDDTNYYSMTSVAPGAGYNVYSVLRGAMSVTGSPNWNTIASVSVSVTATSGGAATVIMDALRITDNDMISSGNILVARKVLPGEFDASVENTKEIEFALAVNIT